MEFFEADNGISSIKTYSVNKNESGH